MTVEKKTALFTNLFLAARSGSELHTLELAKYFANNGWDVTCFTLVYAYPLQAEFEAAAIKVVTFGHEEQLEDHYDLLFAQHKLVSEYLWDTTRINFGKTIISILGVVTEQEGLPHFAHAANAIACISKEAQNAILHSTDTTLPPTLVLPNYATQDYFNREPHPFPDAPQSIAIVSNHVPSELRELGTLCQAQNITATYFGYETKSVEITPELLASFDLVISIGRTAQLCFAAGVPFYCYDHFGGPGYIPPSDLEQHGFNNFSGRSEPLKHNASELFDDINRGYSDAVENLPVLRQLAKEHYDCAVIFQKLLDITSEDMPKSALRAEATNDTKELRSLKCSDFIRDFGTYIGHAQVFYKADNDKSISDENSRWIDYRYNSEIRYMVADGSTITRFDPDIRPCTCNLVCDSKHRAAPDNGTATDRDDCFYDMDPCYVDLACNSISFCCQPLSWDSVAARARSLEQECNRRSYRAFNQVRTIALKALRRI